MLSLLTCSLIFALVLAYPHDLHKSPAKHFSSSDTYPPSHYDQIYIIPDTGFYSFYFDEPRTHVFQNFVFSSSFSTFLNVTDCYCSGDSFIAFDNGVLVGAVNQNCVQGDSTCATYGGVIGDCLGITGFCTNAPILLPPGNHNITLIVTNGPYRFGKAFLGLYQACTFNISTMIPCCGTLGFPLCVIGETTR